MSDRPRLLASRSELGYVPDSQRALRAEPEAVDEETQLEFTRQAHRRQADRLRREWTKARGMILGGVDAFQGASEGDPALRNQLRVIPRTVERIDRQLGL